MTKQRILITLVLGALLSGCISGTKPADTYVGRDGKTTIIETDKDTCKRECNEDYSRCMDTTSASDNSGVIGPSGVFGASGECRSSLQACLPTCKSVE